MNIEQLSPDIILNSKNIFFEYLSKNGYLEDRKIQLFGNVYKDFLKIATQENDIKIYKVCKLLVKHYLYQIQTKYSCSICLKTYSRLIFKSRNKHCEFCSDIFKENTKDRLKFNSMNRKIRVRNIKDGSITQKSLKSKLEEQNYKCVYCNVDISKNKHLDHIHPLSKGGLHIINNVQYTCPKCNLVKYNKLDYEKK